MHFILFSQQIAIIPIAALTDSSLLLFPPPNTTQQKLGVEPESSPRIMELFLYCMTLIDETSTVS